MGVFCVFFAIDTQGKCMKLWLFAVFGFLSLLSCSVDEGRELHGVSGLGGYTLQLKKVTLPPGYKAPHNAYFREASSDALNDYYAFEVCRKDGSSECFNPFVGDHGELVINRFILERFTDPLMAIIRFFESGVGTVAGTIDLLRDHKIESALVVGGGAYGGYMGYQQYQKMNAWAQKSLQDYLKSEEFLQWWGKNRAVPSLQKQPAIALQAIRDSLTSLPRESLQGTRRAVWVKRVGGGLKNRMNVPPLVGSVLRKGLYVSAALGFIYLMLPSQKKQSLFRKGARVKGWAQKAGNKGMAASYYLFGGHSLAPLPPVSYHLNKKQIYTTKQTHATDRRLGVEVKDLVPVIASALASFPYYNPIDITHYCWVPEEEVEDTEDVFCYKVEGYTEDTKETEDTAAEDLQPEVSEPIPSTEELFKEEDLLDLGEVAP